MTNITLCYSLNNCNADLGLIMKDKDNSTTVAKGYLLSLPLSNLFSAHKLAFTIGTILLAFGATTLASGASVWDFPFARKTILDASKFFVIAGIAIWLLVLISLTCEWAFRLITKVPRNLARFVYGIIATFLVYCALGYTALAFSYILHLNRCTMETNEDGFCTKKFEDLTAHDMLELNKKPDVPYVFSWLRNTFDP